MIDFVHSYFYRFWTTANICIVRNIKVFSQSPLFSISITNALCSGAISFASVILQILWISCITTSPSACSTSPLCYQEQPLYQNLTFVIPLHYHSNCGIDFIARWKYIFSPSWLASWSLGPETAVLHCKVPHSIQSITPLLFYLYHAANSHYYLNRVYTGYELGTAFFCLLRQLHTPALR